MQNPQHLADAVKRAFEDIHENAMKGLPIVNPVLDVETVGFQEHDGRTVGVIITPWLMSLAVFPGAGDDWSGVEVGTKGTFEFPARKYNFLANEIEGIGTYYGYAMHSPMHEFEHHPHAVANAEAFLEVLMVENPNPEDDLDEDRLARFLDGENMEDIKASEGEKVAACESAPKCASADTKVDGAVTLSSEKPKEVSRRAFLSGGVRNSAGPNANV